MEASDNAASQRRFVDEVQDKGDHSVIDELVAEDVVDHTPFPGTSPGRQGVKEVMGAIRGGFSDHDAEVIHMVADGDLVATYKTFTGTHDGEFLGVPPTGKRATIRVMDFVRYRDGQIVEHWNVVDVAGLMAQLGAD